MSFPRYPEYKDSGVEWLGEVPEHWDVKRLKHISPFIAVGVVVNPTSYTADDGLPYIYGGDIREEIIDWENSRRISIESSEANSKTRLHAGDLLTVRVGAPGITAVVPAECEGGNCASVMLVRRGNFNSHWLCFAMNTRIVRFQVEVVQYGAAQEQFNISHAINFWAPTPPRAEQDAIAAFLDRETAKIDALVAEQRRLMELLKEKRQAVISHAVTQGLNPHAPMKPSGIEWLGDVPGHWEVKRLRDVANLNPSKSEIATLERDALVSFLPMSAIGEDGSLCLDSEKSISELESGYTYFRNGDVTIAKITPCYENGKGALMHSLTQGVGFGTTELIVVRPKPEESCGEFLHFLFVSTVVRNIGESHMYGAGGQKRVPDDFVRNFATGFPPAPEQAAIAAFLDAALAKFDTLTTEAQRAIDLLQERRTALISAAVTGQIDVRGAA
jgi:type I restriction enzyme S subunit